jgi:hypothetical protein
MNEGSGDTVADYSGNERTGTITGATWVDGKCGAGLSFNGQNNLVIISNMVGVDPTSITISAWCKLSGLTGTYQFIMNWKYTDVIYVGYIEGGGTAKARAYIKDDDGTAKYLNGAVDLNDGLYHMITLTFDEVSGNGKLYVDTAQVDSDVWGAGSTLPVSTKSITVGGFASSYPLKGIIDEVYVYNYALNPSEIFALYKEGLYCAVDRTRDVEVRMLKKDIEVHTLKRDLTVKTLKRDLEVRIAQ